MFHFWREGGGGKGNRRMTNHMRIQLGPAHSSPIMQTVCVYEPAGNIQWGTALHLLRLYPSRPLNMAKVSPGKVSGLRLGTLCHVPPLSGTTVPSGRKSGSRVCLQNLNLARANRVAVQRCENCSEIYCGIFSKITSCSNATGVRTVKESNAKSEDVLPSYPWTRVEETAGQLQALANELGIKRAGQISQKTQLLHDFLWANTSSFWVIWTAAELPLGFEWGRGNLCLCLEKLM